MKHYTLKTHDQNRNIYSGKYHSFAECLEDAVAQNINLSYINLRHKDLSNANLDGAYMPHANFKGSNLTGTNLSECLLKNSIFDDTSLYNTCFALSDLQKSSFLGASFGATLIDGTNMQDCRFSTLSCFDLNFYLTRAMSGCQFIDHHYRMHTMSDPPFVLKGFLNSPIVILDQTVKIGSQYFPYEDAMPAITSMIQNVLHIPVHGYQPQNVAG